MLLVKIINKHGGKNLAKKVKQNTKDLKLTMIAYIGRSVRKARRALDISMDNAGDAGKLLGDAERGAIRMAYRLKNISEGLEKKEYDTLAYHMIEAKKSLAGITPSMAKIDLDNAITKITDMEELIKKG